MAREQSVFTATVGRDKGKQFRITEMPARAGHAWATRMLLAMLGSGAEVDEDILSRGMAGLATVALGMVGRLQAAEVQPLLDELLGCVQSIQEKGDRRLIDDDFEEIPTIFQLQKAVFALHVQPFISGGLLTSAPSGEAATAG